MGAGSGHTNFSSKKTNIVLTYIYLIFRTLAQNRQIHLPGFSNYYFTKHVYRVSGPKIFSGEIFGRNFLGNF